MLTLADSVTQTPGESARGSTGRGLPLLETLAPEGADTSPLSLFGANASTSVTGLLRGSTEELSAGEEQQAAADVHIVMADCKQRARAAWSSARNSCPALRLQS